MFKGLKEKLKIGLGHLRIAVFGDVDGWGESRWESEVRGYEKNIHKEFGKLDRAVFGGDSGQPGEVRDAVVNALRHYKPRHIFLLGDIGYPVGITCEEEFDAMLARPFGDLGPQHISTDVIDGNHDAYGQKKERAFLARRLKTPAGKIRRRNFYGASVYDNALVVWFDSSVYDVILGDPEIQDRQETFVERVMQDVRFKDLTKIVLAHHGVYSHGGHGDTNSRDYRKFFNRAFNDHECVMVTGHDHLIDFYGQVGKCVLITSGSMSKLKPHGDFEAHPGFVTFEDGSWSAVVADYPKSKNDED